MGLLRRLTTRLAVVIAVALAASSCTHVHVYALASEAYGGRVPGTAGHTMAGDWIINYLAAHGVVAMDGTTDAAAFRQDYGSGTNIVGMIGGPIGPTTEIVVIGAHYDHIASCDDAGGTSTCNGATDNAAGVAIVLEVAAAFFDDAIATNRAILFAFWDEEESGLRGSNAWIDDNPGLAAQVVTYVNYDIQGANLLPSLREETLAVGPETGGTVLEDAVAAAGGSTALNLHALSIVFGQGRSDHANFQVAGIPAVFFTDATGPCYHTTQDTYAVLDQGKLQEQRDIGVALATALATTATAPAFAAAPLGTFEDAEVILQLATMGTADLALFSPADQTTLQNIVTTIQGIVDAGEAAFDTTALNTLLFSALSLVNLLEDGPDCDGFLE